MAMAMASLFIIKYRFLVASCNAYSDVSFGCVFCAITLGKDMSFCFFWGQGRIQPSLNKEGGGGKRDKISDKISDSVLQNK